MVNGLLFLANRTIDFVRGVVDLPVRQISRVQTCLHSNKAARSHYVSQAPSAMSCRQPFTLRCVSISSTREADAHYCLFHLAIKFRPDPAHAIQRSISASGSAPGKPTSVALLSFHALIGAASPQMRLTWSDNQQPQHTLTCFGAGGSVIR
jgi:hypothetical protein